MSSGNENTSVTPNSGSTPNSGAAPRTTSGSGPISNQEEERINLLASSNQGQDPAQQSRNDTGEDELGMPGNFPVANAVLASCNDILKDFYSSRVSKAVALARIYTVLLDGIPDTEETGANLEEAFERYLSIIENHQNHLNEAENRGRRQRSQSPVNRGIEIDDEDISPPKRAKPDETQYPWVVSDFIHGATLSPSLTTTLELLKLYAIDPKGTKRSLVNSPSCPEFPDSEWTNVLLGRAVNLDAVLSGYYSTSNNDERIEEIGEVEIRFGTVSPTKLVSSAGEWSIAWNRASRAICTAFPHRAGELAEYAEYIIGVFAATDVHFHDRVISFDKAVRRRVGSRRDLELTNFHRFADLRSTHMDSIGAAVVQRASIAATHKSGTSSARGKKLPEPCNRWNEGLCTLENTQCRRLHVCNKCLLSGHKQDKCPLSQ